MTILFEKSIFAMQGTIEHSIIDLAEHLGIECKNGEKFGVIYQRLLETCPKLHNNEEHKKLAELFIKDFIEEFNHNELRIWYECTAPLTFGDEMLMVKYSNLLKTHNKWVYKWVNEHELQLRVDVFLFGIEVRKEYCKTGVTFDTEYAKEWVLQLWGLVKTIHDSYYDTNLIDALESSIKSLLYITGAEYYTTLDLKDKKVLKDLYYVLCEVNHTGDGFKGHDMFYTYDGYGNTVFEVDGDIITEW